MVESAAEKPMARADTAFRRRLAIAAVVGIAAGAWAIRLLAVRLRELEALAASSPEAASDRFLALARWVLAAPAGGLLICALLLVRLGLRARACATFPPPGARLLADQPVVTGPAARRRAALVAVLGLLAAAGAVTMPYLIYLRLVAVLANAS